MLFPAVLGLAGMELVLDSTDVVPLSNTFQAADIHPFFLYYHYRIGFMQLIIKYGWQFYWISRYVEIGCPDFVRNKTTSLLLIFP